MGEMNALLDDQIIELRKELQAGINQCFGPNYNAAVQ
jgi:hypothetical protein